MPHSRPLCVALAAAVLLASVPRAHAQTVYAPPPPPTVYAPAPYGYAPVYYAPLVPLTLDGDTTGLRYEVVGPKGDDRVFGRCASPCTLQLPAGEYRVRVEGESIPSKQSPVRLEGATRVFSEAGSTSGKNGGLVLAIAGTSVAGIGLAVALTASMSGGCWMSECSSGTTAQKRRDEANSTAGVALAIAGVGALLGTVGWITFASNRTRMSVANAYPAPTVSFGVAPTYGGGSFALAGTF